MYAPITCKCGGGISNTPAKIKAPPMKLALEHLQRCEPENNWDFAVTSKGQWHLAKGVK